MKVFAAENIHMWQLKQLLKQMGKRVFTCDMYKFPMEIIEKCFPSSSFIHSAIKLFGIFQRYLR